MRITLTNWQEVIEQSACLSTKLTLMLRQGELDAWINAYWYPSPDPDEWFEIRPVKTESWREVQEIFFSWEQLEENTKWDGVFWFLFTHPENKLPCIVEWTANLLFSKGGDKVLARFNQPEDGQAGLTPHPLYIPPP